MPHGPVALEEGPVQFGVAPNDGVARVGDHGLQIDQGLALSSDRLQARWAGHRWEWAVLE